MPQPVRRYVAVYDQHTDELVNEIDLLDQSLSWIQELFGLATDNPAHDCYPIDATALHAVLQRLPDGTAMDLDRFAYMVECVGA
jgi:hypothetical protein